MFLSADAPLKQDVQGGILHPAHRQDSLRNQENVLVPIHPPLIINLSDEEDDEEDDQEDDDEEDSCNQFFCFISKLNGFCQLLQCTSQLICYNDHYIFRKELLKHFFK